MNKLEDAKRRFGMPPHTTHQMPAIFMQGFDEGVSKAIGYKAEADGGTNKQLQARNLRLKMEVNALQKLLNEKDEELDSLRDPKWIRWACATLVVVLVGLASFMRLN